MVHSSKEAIIQEIELGDDGAPAREILQPIQISA
jgi:hypothetical protein